MLIEIQTNVTSKLSQSAEVTPLRAWSGNKPNVMPEETISRSVTNKNIDSLFFI
jgi:hypothetical protein